MTAATAFDSPELKEKLDKLGVSLFTIPPPEGEELHRLEGWRDNIERYGQDLWAIYHWIVKAQDGNTLDDLFPGSGQVGRMWDEWRQQPTIPIEAPGPSAVKRAGRRALAKADHPGLIA